MLMLNARHWRTWSPSKVGLVAAIILFVVMSYNAWQTIVADRQATAQVTQRLADMDSGLRRPVQTVTAASIPAWHLFGIAPPVIGIVPPTTLALKLVGVLLDHDPRYSQAIIADSAGVEGIYQVNDRVPGEATIREILPYRVILERDGTLEALSLPQKGLTFQPMTSDNLPITPIRRIEQ